MDSSMRTVPGFIAAETTEAGTVFSNVPVSVRVGPNGTTRGVGLRLCNPAVLVLLFVVCKHAIVFSISFA
jgi:hypothetical protein